MSIELNGASEDTPVINYTPDFIDEYMVIVNSPEDWEEVHNYIINENEIDGIPNRKINCSNVQEFSLRTAIYEMSVEEAESLKRYSKIETVELNPDKYPQPQSIDSARFGNVVAFNKPLLPAALDAESIAYKNGVRSNWSMLFVNNPSSEPFQGVGISTVDYVERDIPYSVTGRNVDAVTIDTGMGILHPEFISGDGTYRVFDVILDGPYKVDPDFFNADPSNRLETVTIDSVVIGTRAKESVARDWWANTGTSYRSAAYSSVGTVSISSSYTRIHAHSKNGTNAVLNSHGTSCASQIGGKSFGLAYECNLWNIRIALGGAGGVIGSDTALNACTIWHKAKKIQSTDPDPTLVNNSYGGFSSTGNNNGTTYSHYYRGQSKTYTGTGSADVVPSDAGACRNHKYFTYNVSGSSGGAGYAGSGQYTTTGSTTNTAAENAIAAGCIMVSSAGNTNQKLSDKNDVDFGNWYVVDGIYTNRVGGVQQGFSGDHETDKGCIRVGAIDCAVEPADEKQGATKYSIRKVCYSANGPMVDIFAPAEKSMSAAYASSEDYQRNDDSNFYDTWFNGTSSAGPNVCSVIALYLQSNRGANQDNVRHWLYTDGSKDGLMSDPYSGINDTGYWSQSYNASTDQASNINESYNYRGNGNLRGAANRVLFNPYASDITPAFTNIIGGESIITDNLVLNLDGNNYTSGSTWNDSSGEGHHGTIYGSTYNSDNGGYFDFDGSNDYINISDTGVLPSGTNSFTYSIWVYIDTISGPWGGSRRAASLFSGDTNGTAECGLFRNSNTTGAPETFRFTRHGGGNTGSCQVNVSMNQSQWYNITLVRDGASSQVVYQDGVQIGTGNLSNSFSSNSMRIGGAVNSSSYHAWLDGRIGSVLMYNSALSASEVKHNFDAMKGRYVSSPLIISGSFGGENIITSDLVLNLDANNYTSGTTWTDTSGQSNDGTLTNGITYSSENGGVLVLNGTSDYITTGSDMFNANSNFTFSMWFNSDDFSEQKAFCADVDNSQCLFLRYNNGIQVVNSNTLALGSFSSSTLSTNIWYNVTVTRSSNTYTLYVDGDFKSTVSTSQGFSHSPDTIGANQNLAGGAKNFFDGKIAKVLAYSTALSASEVEKNYDAMKGRFLSSSLSILQT